MAILYGTQSNGESLPVLVDQFGNLIAKGIEGQQGPPGPPGVGELPPDPYEGAILGWQDGELAWIGGSVPLPAGTYGPYVYVAEGGTLDVPQDASDLVNGQQLYMSNEKGEIVNHIFQTDTIVSVREVDVTYSISLNVTQPDVYTGNASNVFDTDLTNLFQLQGRGYNPMGTATITIPVTDNNGAPVTHLANTISLKAINYGQSYSYGEYEVKDFTVTYTDNTTATLIGTLVDGETTATNPNPNKSIKQIVTVVNRVDNNDDYSSNGIKVYYVKFDGKALISNDSSKTLIFPTNNNFDKFEVGDVVQDSDVKITDIDAAGPTITVDGGSWKGVDGSGTLEGQTGITTTYSGSGSVSMGLNGRIVLRNNNGEWVDGFYVTAPEQRIASRKILPRAIKKTTN